MLSMLRCELNLAHINIKLSHALSSDFSMTKVVSESTPYCPHAQNGVRNEICQYVLPLSDTSLADIHVDG